MGYWQGDYYFGDASDEAAAPAQQSAAYDMNSFSAWDAYNADVARMNTGGAFAGAATNNPIMALGRALGMAPAEVIAWQQKYGESTGIPDFFSNSDNHATALKALAVERGVPADNETVAQLAAAASGMHGSWSDAQNELNGRYTGMGGIMAVAGGIGFVAGAMTGFGSAFGAPGAASFASSVMSGAAPSANALGAMGLESATSAALTPGTQSMIASSFAANGSTPNFGINLPSQMPFSEGLGQFGSIGQDAAFQMANTTGTLPSQFAAMGAGDWLPSTLVNSTLANPDTFSNSIIPRNSFEIREGYGQADPSLMDQFSKARDAYKGLVDPFVQMGMAEDPTGALYAPERPQDDTNGFAAENDAIFRSAKNMRGPGMGSFSTFNIGAPGLYIP